MNTNTQTADSKQRLSANGDELNNKTHKQNKHYSKCITHYNNKREKEREKER